MCSSHRNSCYIDDVRMEIKSAYFPPPTIVIPKLDIPALKNYAYKFDKEKEVIEYYDKEKRRLEASKNVEKQVYRKPADSLNNVPIHTAAAQQNRVHASYAPSHLSVASTSRTEVIDDPFSNVISKIPILTPEPLIPSSASSDASQKIIKVSSNDVQTPGGSSATKFCDFEEFEATTTLFDLMELKSLDDRKELEKLLM